MDRRVFEECILNKVSIYGDEFNNSELSLWAEQELEWCRSKGIDIILYDDVKYPILLKECEDAPRLLYYKGNCDLNGDESLSIVGTRLASYSGRESCDSIIKSFTDNTFSPVIVSGLAYGVDVSAHRAALKYNLNTIAVLPCGLDEIYPSSHRDIASRIVKQGAIITEFPKGTHPIRRNFIRRNSIIAGISQGTLIVDSRVKGGSMVTVELDSKSVV